MQDYDHSKQMQLCGDEKPLNGIRLIDLLNTKNELDGEIDKCEDKVDHLYQDFGILYKIREFLNDNEFVKLE